MSRPGFKLRAAARYRSEMRAPFRQSKMRAKRFYLYAAASIAVYLWMIWVVDRGLRIAGY